ncbi:hypothetical protein RB2501_14239 [Robiginitalea biformata HTCC2501]|uniref:Uncharacterized protein n=1 Tax=Robiginitalea biformata (strain ATCC BAA-864 / DSM 15991 / KCTC 12146 / HTCC2501) TaxID=313596 RepID=A4CKU5_ROBBH|nr:hypothetical protein RB2501_14239 [Robiginitalea biformata HTCC2501]
MTYFYPRKHGTQDSIHTAGSRADHRPREFSETQHPLPEPMRTAGPNG